MAFGITAFAESPFAATGAVSITVAVTGQSLSTNINSVVINADANVSVTGIALTSVTGNEDIFAGVVVFATGISSTINIGTSVAQANADVDVTGISLSVNLGTSVITPNTIAQITGQSLNTQIGIVDPSPDAMVTGIGMTATVGVGSVVVATADIDVTGISLTAGIGSLTVTADANIPLTGVSASVSLPSPLVFTGFGDAQISTAQSKFGGASLLLDGTGDYLESEGAYNFGSDPFTVDMWVRPTSGTQDGIFFDSRDSTSNDTIALRQSTDNLLVIRGNVTLFNINNVFSENTWVHIAVTRGDPFGNTYSVFVNGVKEGSSLFGVTATAASIHIGSDFNGSNNWEGYIDELRVANVDEYGGTDFTPPTSAYTADENIPILLHFDGANGSTTFTNDGIVQSVTVTANADIQVSGISLTSLIGNEDITGDTNVSISGIPLTTAVGTVDHNSTYTVSGEQLTTAIGQAEATDASAEITGIGLTTSTGTVKFILWSEVDTGTDVTWTEVDIAA